MPKKTIAYLKSKFTTGLKPSQGDLWDWLESFVHIDALTALNNATIDARIDVYDEALRGVSPSSINTLGDILRVLTGMPYNYNIKSAIDSAGGVPSWSAIQNKPANVPVSWSEQVIINNWLPTWDGVSENMPTRSFSTIGGISGQVQWVVKDITIQSFLVPVAGTSQTWHANRIASVTMAKSLYVNLSTAS